jgi:hypothetical protein
MKTDLIDLREDVEMNQQRPGGIIGQSVEMKYVILGVGPMERALVFPKEICHNFVLGAAVTHKRFNWKKIFSAGWCKFHYKINDNLDTYLVVKTWGESESIKTDLEHIVEAQEIKPWESKKNDDIIIYASYVGGPWDYMWPWSDEE